MKKLLILFGIILLSISLVVHFTNADISVPSFFKKSGNNILFQNSSWELGSSESRIAKGWFTNLDTNNIAIGGTTTGNLDMNNNLILHIGTSTTNFTTGGGLNLAGDLNAYNVIANPSAYGFTFSSAPGVIGMTDYNGDGASLYLYANSSVPLILYGSTPGWSAQFNISNLTANQTFNFPNQSGTIALAENVVPYTGAIADIIPNTDSSINLGSSAPKYFANAYIRKLYFNPTATLDGTIPGRITLMGELSFRIGAIIYSPSDTILNITAQNKINIGYYGNSDYQIQMDTLNRVIKPIANNIWSFGGSTNYFKDAYVSQIYLNSTATLSGATAGSIGITGKVGIGTTTPAYNLQVLDTVSSTMAVGDATHTGCLVMGDSDGVGVTYLYVNDGVLMATSTKPAFCQ